MQLLIVAATPQELTGTLSFLRENAFEKTPFTFQYNGLAITICITGVGMVAATFGLGKMLFGQSFGIVIIAGVGGVYAEQYPLGQVVVVQEEAFGDIGAEEQDGNLLDLFELGLAEESEFPFESKKLISQTTLPPNLINLPKAKAITVATCAGTSETIAKRIEKHNADIESMEGAAYAYVCEKMGQPYLQLRAISNHVAPRDKSAWVMEKAIANLNSVLVETLQRISSTIK